MKYKYLSYPTILVAFCIFGYYQTSKKNQPLSQPALEESTFRKNTKSTKSEDSATHSTAVAPTQQTASAPRPNSVSAPQPITEFSGHHLYSYLYSRDFKNKKISATDVSLLRERFKKAYSQKGVKHHSEATREASNRMGLLKSFAMNPSAFTNKEVRQQLSSFFESVSLNPQENLMVRRQALRSLASLQRGSHEAQSKALHRKHDKHIRSLASLSDQEIIEAALEK